LRGFFVAFGMAGWKPCFRLGRFVQPIEMPAVARLSK
jgi:hypothetical protein